jgi:predicted ATPase
MMNQAKSFLISAIVLMAVILLGSGPSLAGPNPNKGKTIYKTTCKTCHSKNAEAKELTPISKTIAQWERFFGKGIESCLKRVETKTGKKLTAAEIEDMKFFLVSHAADSDRPETCGEN